jgi:hypothetical protein
MNIFREVAKCAHLKQQKALKNSTWQLLKTKKMITRKLNSSFYVKVNLLILFFIKAKQLFIMLAHTFNS